MSEKHNGYANYETWCVHLWLTNEEQSYKFWREEARQHMKIAPESEFDAEAIWDAELAATANLANQLKDSLEESTPLLEADVYSDLLNTALGRVDWHEIAACFLEDFRLKTVEPAPKPTTQSVDPLFELGRTVSTPTAIDALTHEEIAVALGRHVRGDWGLVGPEDWQENETSLKEGFRLLSVYESADKTRFWIITEADRSVTTVLLPNDY